jgi:hypothetical protein
MPFSERGLMQLWAKQAIKALEKAAAMILRIRAKYDPTHPEYVEAIDALLQATSDLRDAYIKFARMI